MTSRLLTGPALSHRPGATPAFASLCSSLIRDVGGLPGCPPEPSCAQTGTLDRDRVGSGPPQAADAEGLLVTGDFFRVLTDCEQKSHACGAQWLQGQRRQEALSPGHHDTHTPLLGCGWCCVISRGSSCAPRSPLVAVRGRGHRLSGPPRRRGRGPCPGATPPEGLASGSASHPNVSQRPHTSGPGPTPHRGTGLLPEVWDLPVSHTQPPRTVGKKGRCPCPAVSGPRGGVGTHLWGCPRTGHGTLLSWAGPPTRTAERVVARPSSGTPSVSH